MRQLVDLFVTKGQGLSIFAVVLFMTFLMFSLSIEIPCLNVDPIILENKWGLALLSERLSDAKYLGDAKAVEFL
jgi:hypothetical protein